MTIVSQAPTRVDLAGGTLDIWPLYLFHKTSQTINFAINCHAKCWLTPRRGSAIELRSRDLDVSEKFSSLRELTTALDKKNGVRLPLLARLTAAFAPSDGFTLETDSESPAGAGLGGSSALNIAVCGALARFKGEKLSAPKLIEIARNVEAQVLGVPTGEQDYYSAMYGGVQAIQLTPFGVFPKKLSVNAEELGLRIVLCYTGQSRNSGFNNWEVMKAHIDGNRAVVTQFDGITKIAVEMRTALESADWNTTAKLIDMEWRLRKKNHPGISTPGIERLMDIARRNGGISAKVCGAGGGGCVTFFVKPEAKGRVESALQQAGATVLPISVFAKGLLVKEQSGKSRSATTK